MKSDFYKKITLIAGRVRRKYFIFLIFGLVFIFGANLYLSVKSGGPIEYVSSQIAVKLPEQSVITKPPVQHLKTPHPVKGIYMSSWVSGTQSWREELVDFVKKTELNTLIIDVKDYSGRVSFDTGDEKIKEVGSEEIRVRDLSEFIEELHKNGIYAIARITVFQDPYYAKKYPQSAVKRQNGAIWKDKKRLSYVDPSAEDFWSYIVEIGRASKKVGFDELNFDYIRFPSDGDMSDVVFPHSENVSKPNALDAFFAYLSSELKKDKDSVPISADVFGMTTTNEDDLGIGQILERVASHFDYISPMVYPSHYPPTFHGFKNPAEHPYEVVNFSMSEAVRRLSAPTSTPASPTTSLAESRRASQGGPEKLRPWIQDFDLGAIYDAAKVRAQMQATYDAGLDSWMSWDAGNKYTRGAYNLE